jgi:prevent-host-death family protein
MPIVNMLAAKTNLSRWVEQVESGAVPEIIIARNGKPAARIVPIEPSARADRTLGLAAGQYPTSSQEEFDELNDRIAAMFDGES